MGVRIFNLYLVNLLYFASLIQNTVGKTITARYPFILIYAFAMVLVKLMQKMQIKIQIPTCQIWILVFFHTHRINTWLRRTYTANILHSCQDILQKILDRWGEWSIKKQQFFFFFPDYKLFKEQDWTRNQCTFTLNSFWFLTRPSN